MGDYSEVFVGIDVAKTRNAIAIADGKRGAEARVVGEADATEVSMRWLESGPWRDMIECGVLRGWTNRVRLASCEYVT